MAEPSVPVASIHGNIAFRTGQDARDFFFRASPTSQDSRRGGHFGALFLFMFGMCGVKSQGRFVLILLVVGMRFGFTLEASGIYFGVI